MSTENPIPPPNTEKEKLSNLIRDQFVKPVEFLAIDGMAQWELEKSVMVDFDDEEDIDYCLDISINSQQEIADDAFADYHDTPSHEVDFSKFDKDGRRMGGKTFRLIGSTLYVTPRAIGGEEESREMLYYSESQRKGEISLIERAKLKRMREAQVAADKLATYEAGEADLVELAVVLEKFRSRKKTVHVLGRNK